MKRFSLFSAVILFACSLWADTEGIWNYRISGDSVMVTGCTVPTGNLVIPGTLGGKPVTSIGGRAFYNCSSLTAITIPDSVTSIGSGAFQGCSGLTGITIPEGVTSIGSDVFQGCSGLTSITIPESVTSIGSSAFNGCSGLTSITIPEGVTSIWVCACSSCSGLTSITIPEGVTSIGDSAFQGCSGLTSITIPEGVTSIGGSAFNGCSGLTSITIPEGVTSIGGSAFNGCRCVILLCDVPVEYYSIGGDVVYYSKKYAANWMRVIPQSQWGYYVDIMSFAKAEVKAEMTTPKTMSVKYKVTGAKSGKVKVRAVAFKDGVRSFANIVPVRSGTNVPNGNEVATDTEHSFVWNVSEDWDIDLAKVAIEILVQEGALLLQDLVTIPANGTNKAMTITQNAITEEMAFDALLWCYVAGDAALVNTDGVVKYNGVQIAYGGSVQKVSNPYSSYKEYYTDQTALLNYLYGKMGYKVLAGEQLAYAEKMTRLDFADSGDADWKDYVYTRDVDGKSIPYYVNQIRQVSVKVEE